jgi:CheY-like chemotaxis protein
MPILDGIEASRKILELQKEFNAYSDNKSDVKIVAVTSNYGDQYE